MKKILLMLVVTLLIGVSQGFAQQRTLTGQVTDANDGQPLPGVTISVIGVNRSVQTESNGTFSISVEPGQILRFSYLGYDVQEINPGNNASLNVKLSQNAEALGEVVVTAMGIRRETKSLGYSVQEINSTELLKNKEPNVINSLNGKISGVNITNSGGAPGSSASIIIRGGTSLEGNNQPLFIIDGMPIDNSTGQGDNSAFDGSVNISTTNRTVPWILTPKILRVSRY